MVETAVETSKTLEGVLIDTIDKMSGAFVTLKDEYGTEIIENIGVAIQAYSLVYLLFYIIVAMGFIWAWKVYDNKLAKYFEKCEVNPSDMPPSLVRLGWLVFGWFIPFLMFLQIMSVKLWLGAFGFIEAYFAIVVLEKTGIL